MKRFFTIILVLMLLIFVFSGCVPKEADLTSDLGFVFTPQNLPRIDGSTATIPLAQAVRCGLVFPRI